MAHSERLASRVREILAEGGQVAERRMFGGLAFMVNGHMCCGIIRDDLMLRLGADRAGQALREPHVRPMDFTGRPLRGFIFVDKAGFRSRAALESWLRPAIQFVSTLPRRPR